MISSIERTDKTLLLWISYGLLSGVSIQFFRGHTDIFNRLDLSHLLNVKR